MTPELVVFTLRSLLKVGEAVNESWEQSVRDGDLAAPDLKSADSGDFNRLCLLYQTNGRLKERVGTGGDLAHLWNPDAANGQGAPVDQSAAEQLRAEAQTTLITLISTSSLRERERAEGAAQLKQWKPGAGPPPPYARVVLSLASVAAQYVHTNPSLLASGERGEQLVKAIAEQIGPLLPDVDDPTQWKDVHWTRYYFAERSLSILLQAGLKSINANPGLVVRQAHLQALVKGTTVPLLQAFQEQTADPLNFLRLQDALLGPVAEAAFKAVAENQARFLGSRFAPETAAGALVASALAVVGEQGLRSAFQNDDMLIAIISAALGVAAKRPELFFDAAGTPKGELSKALISNVAQALKNVLSQNKLGDLRGLPVDIAVTVLNTIAEHGTALMGGDDTWHKVAGDAVSAIANGLADGLKTEGLRGFQRLFSPHQATELIRIVLSAAARTPGMLVGESAKAELQTLVAAIASAMAADKSLLLAPEDWHAIAAVAADEAARNPGRLFDISESDPAAQLGTRLIAKILAAAATGFKANGRGKGFVGFGEVLADAVGSTLRAAAGNLDDARIAVGLSPSPSGQSLDNLGKLVTGLNDAVAATPGKVGSQQWGWLFKNLIIEAIDEGEKFEVTGEKLTALLSDPGHASPNA